MRWVNEWVWIRSYVGDCARWVSGLTEWRWYVIPAWGMNSLVWHALLSREGSAKGAAAATRLRDCRLLLPPRLLPRAIIVRGAHVIFLSPILSFGQLNDIELQFWWISILYLSSLFRNTIALAQIDSQERSVKQVWNSRCNCFLCERLKQIKSININSLSDTAGE